MIFYYNRNETYTRIYSFFDNIYFQNNFFYSHINKKIRTTITMINKNVYQPFLISYKYDSVRDESENNFHYHYDVEYLLF